MHSFKKYIDQQIEANRRKNIFYKGSENHLSFIEPSQERLRTPGETDEAYTSVLIYYTTDRALEEFYRINQYYL